MASQFDDTHQIPSANAITNDIANAAQAINVMKQRASHSNRLAESPVFTNIYLQGCCCSTSDRPETVVCHVVLCECGARCERDIGLAVTRACVEGQLRSRPSRLITFSYPRATTQTLPRSRACTMGAISARTPLYALVEHYVRMPLPLPFITKERAQ